MFVKPDVIKMLSPSELQKLDVRNPSSLLPLKHVFIGAKTAAIISKWKLSSNTKVRVMNECTSGLPVTLPEPAGAESEYTAFMETVCKAYQDTAEYMLKKMPLDNKLLSCLSATDPKAFLQDTCVRTLTSPEKLSNYFPTVSLDLDQYKLECRKLQNDPCLPPCADVHSDDCWAQVFSRGCYSQLSLLMKAALSIPSAPSVDLV